MASWFLPPCSLLVGSEIELLTYSRGITEIQVRSVDIATAAISFDRRWNQLLRPRGVPPGLIPHIYRADAASQQHNEEERDN
jgi:hypothetical protein